MSDETTLHESSDVLITDKRVVINGTTYATGNITSVRAERQSKSLLMPLLVFGVAVILGWFIGDTVGSIVWLVGLVAAVAVLVVTKPSYVVKIASASGEVRALVSPNQERVAEVAKAINQAIVNRG